MKVLNLYAGIGGNRKLWPKECEVTAIENNHDIADIYMDFFPNDKVYCVDAHKYLLEHFKEFDFIWASPPCPTHSRMRLLCAQQTDKRVYPDMRLYQEIILLKEWFKGKWVVENVISYYEPLIKPYPAGKHYFWANFNIPNFKEEARKIRRDKATNNQRKNRINFDLSSYNLKERDETQYLNNCVNPKLGLHIFNCAFKEKQETL